MYAIECYIATNGLIVCTALYFYIFIEKPVAS